MPQQKKVAPPRPQARPIALESLAARLHDSGFAAELSAGNNATAITGVSLDSRQIQAGDLYVAAPGTTRHGINFLEQALAAGALAVCTDTHGKDRALAAGVPVLTVPDVRKVLGDLAHAIYNPQSAAAPLKLAVTGTNGKTTTTFIIAQIYAALKQKTGLIGTVETRIGDSCLPSSMTTPEAPQTHALLAVMRERQVAAAIMEVSSHALDFGRVAGVKYDVAGFTNLTQDHLDLHLDMQSYLRSKAQLFTAVSAAKAVINVDDAAGQQLLKEAQTNLSAAAVSALYTGGGRGIDPVELQKIQSRREPAWCVTDTQQRGGSQHFQLRHTDGTAFQAVTALPGYFNVANAALAVAMVAAAGVPVVDLQRVLGDPLTLSPIVPGRMQVISDAPLTIVDYAHNPDALEKVLTQLAQPPAGGRKIVVFGATGKREIQKRPLMGKIAATYADIVIVTDDDPYGDPPEVIRQQVLAGCRRVKSGSAEILEIAPREAAIRRAIELATPADTVLIAGRGHEVSQTLSADNSRSLDDREVAREFLRSSGYKTID